MTTTALRSFFLENPLVLRAFRTGFRRGRGAFRLGAWVAVLAMVLVANVAPAALLEDNRFWQNLLVSLLCYTALSFTLAGLLRVVGSFSDELDRGTFEFIHLSTMRPTAVIFGFLLAGQLPGYLLLGLTVPLMTVAAHFAGMSLLHLLLLLVTLAGYVVVLSLFLLHFGFWRGKGSRLTALVFLAVLAVVFLFVMFVVSNTVLAAWLPMQHMKLLLVQPVLSSIWARSLGSAASGSPGIPFFGVDLTLEAHAALLFLPLALVSFASLARSIRYREDRPISNRWSLVLGAWLCFYFVASLWDPSHLAGQRVFSLYLVTLVAFTALIVAPCVRPGPAMVSICHEAQGSVRRMLVHPQAPPYGVLAVLTVLMLAAAILARAGAPAGEQLHLLALAGIPLLLWVGFLLAQLLEWRGRSGRAWVWVFHASVLFLPPLVWAVMDSAFLRKWIPFFDDVAGMSWSWLGMASPLAQIAALTEGAAPDPEGFAIAWRWTLVFDGFYGFLIVALLGLHAREWRAFRKEAAVEERAPGQLAETVVASAARLDAVGGAAAADPEP